MAGYWSSSFFACLSPDLDEVEVNELAKKERGQYPAILTEQTWSIKDLLYGLGKFFLRDTAGSPERARWLHHARLGSQSHRAIWFILPARGRGANHVVKPDKVTTNLNLNAVNIHMY